MLAMYPEVQEKLAEEAQGLGDTPDFSAISKLRYARDVFREVLRLYPPVPMMVRENTCPEEMRDRKVAPGAQIVLSPWHLHRHERIWDRPDEFDPSRWQTEENRVCARDAYMPFSAGPRVCTGAGFAMVEGPLLLAMLARAFRFELTDGLLPVPVAHLTVRAKAGIRLKISRR
jgi:cytochrome P450